MEFDKAATLRIPGLLAVVVSVDRLFQSIMQGKKDSKM